MTYKDIRENREVLAYLKKGNDNLGTMGFTDHSGAHCAMVAERAAMILEKFGYSEHDREVAKIAGFMHDMGKRHQPATAMQNTARFWLSRSYPERTCPWRTGSRWCPPLEIMTNPPEGPWTPFRRL